MDNYKKVIPPECFQKNLFLSLYYFFFDVLVIISLFWFYFSFLSTSPYFFLFYPLYLFLQGMFMWSLFVIGHDCGHGSFSQFPLVNNLFGHLSHGFLLVPYKPWALSHSYHHRYHNHIEKDLSHRWTRKEEFKKMNLINIPYSLFIPISSQIYLYFGYPDGSHIWPGSKLFKTFEERIWCLISTSWILINLYGFSYILSFQEFIWSYFLPWIIYNIWLVMITYLQHHSLNRTTAFDSESWSFIKGAEETYDRQFGFLIDHLTHHITDGHLAHHLFFTTIPHYHLPKATQALRGASEKVRKQLIIKNFFQQVKEFILTWDESKYYEPLDRPSQYHAYNSSDQCLFNPSLDEK